MSLTLPPSLLLTPLLSVSSPQHPQRPTSTVLGFCTLSLEAASIPGASVTPSSSLCHSAQWSSRPECPVTFLTAAQPHGLLQQHNCTHLLPTRSCASLITITRAILPVRPHPSQNHGHLFPVTTPSPRIRLVPKSCRSHQYSPLWSSLNLSPPRHSCCPPLRRLAGRAVVSAPALESNHPRQNPGSATCSWRP